MPTRETTVMSVEQKSLEVLLQEAQLRKLEAETKKIKVETSRLWFELGKLVFSGGVGLAAGLLTQSAQVNSANAEKAAAVNESKQLGQENNESILPLQDDLNKVRAELDKVRAELRQAKAQLQSPVTEANIVESKKPEKPLIYIHFQGSTTRIFINELRSKLQSEYHTPGAQRLAGTYASEVRYHPLQPDGKAMAEKLAKSVQQFFQENGCSLKLNVVELKRVKDQPTPPEVWLSAEDYCR